MQAPKILPVDPQPSDREKIHRAATLIKGGGLAIFPTSSFYGIAARAFDSRAVDRVFQVKKRNPQSPILILIASIGNLAPLVKSVPTTAVRLIEAFWPGGLTLVFDSAGILPPNLTGHTGKIGIRLPAHPVAHELVRAVGEPITGTSANVTGRDSCTEVAQLDSYVMEGVDLVLDAGQLGGGKASTVADVTTEPPTVLREGVIHAERIREVLEG
jgi:L-threonylcarbamoyladenylate synthase